MRRRTAVAGAVALTLSALTGGVPSASAAAAPTHDTVTIQVSDSIDCGSFSDNFTDFYTGSETTFYDAAGNITKQIIHWTHTSNDVNSTTGYTIHEHGSFTETIDYVAGTDANAGSFEIATKPGTGIVIADVGRIVYDAHGNVVFFATSHVRRLAFSGGDERYCSALSG
jgi:hypothetical protein